MRSIRFQAAVVIATMAAGVVGAAGFTPRPARARAAYERAVQLRSKLEAEPAGDRSRSEYRDVITAFRAVFYADPSYEKAPLAAEAVGDLYAEMGRTFSDPAASKAAIKAYEFLISQYPGSSMAADAAFAEGEVYFKDLSDSDSATKAYQSFLDDHPGAVEAQTARQRLKEIADLSKQAEDSDSGGNGLVRLTEVHDIAGPDYNRIVIGTEGPVKFNTFRLSNPDRIVFDLQNTYVSRKMNGKDVSVSGNFLQDVRVAQFKPTVTRVVLDVNGVTDFSVFPLPNPFRLIVDLRGPESELAKSSRPKAGSTTGSAKNTQQADVLSGSIAPTAVIRPAADTTEQPLAAAKPASSPKPTHLVATAASPTHSGAQTLTRALGLKVARIVIDPGHGGHDTGTIGQHGILEKDVALDVALRLRKLIEENTSDQVIMTRSDDTFIPLEERTAIANKAHADLFISIHLNASHTHSVRGIETYYLNFTRDPDALEVAARENAGSGESEHQLHDLIRKIALNDKIEESQEFARDVQKELYKSESRVSDDISNRGVRKAPFVVLIGAHMPSILAEISFLSNSHDERLLRKASYQERIAKALFKGIEDYTSDLGSVRMAQSTK